MTVDSESLGSFGRTAREGAERAAANLADATGIETTVDVSQPCFVPVEDVPAELGDREHVGTVLAFGDEPRGYVVILFDEPSAREVVAALDPEADAEAFDATARSAIREIGNVMTSGFVDGWANVLDTTIDISTPQFVHDMGRSVADSIAARIGQRRAFALLYEAALRADDRAFDCRMYAIPDEADLRTILEYVDPDATAERTTKAGSP